MSVDTVLSELAAFIEFSTYSRPGVAVLGLLAAVVAIIWVATEFARWMIGYVMALARVVVTAVASLSTVLIVTVVLVVFAVTG
jgi:hypothetical protein